MSNFPKGQVSQFFGSKVTAGGGAGNTKTEVLQAQLNF